MLPVIAGVALFGAAVSFLEGIDAAGEKADKWLKAKKAKKKAKKRAKLIVKVLKCKKGEKFFEREYHLMCKGEEDPAEVLREALVRRHESLQPGEELSVVDLAALDFIEAVGVHSRVERRLRG